MELEAPATLRVVGASCSRIALGAMELEAPATLIMTIYFYFVNFVHTVYF